MFAAPVLMARDLFLFLSLYAETIFYFFLFIAREIEDISFFYFIIVYIVFHSWTVPILLGIKVDAFPGRINQLNLIRKPVLESSSVNVRKFVE